MHRLVHATMLLLALAAASSAEVPTSRAATPGGLPLAVEPKPIPPFAFEDMAGKPASLADFAGKVVVLNFWATWCAPCREEMPSLDRLQALFEPSDVVVVALSVDRAGSERVQAFLAEIGALRLRVYRDPSAASTRAVKIPGLPATLLIDRQGREVGRLLGPAEWDSPALVEIIRKLAEQGS